jgi:3-keto steroid reductase
MIDEFLHTRPQSQVLHLLFSTRDSRKSEDTLRRLNSHLQSTLKQADKKTPGVSLLLEPQIKLEGVQVDLARLLTVKALAQQLLSRGQRIDGIVCNAGINGFKYLDWVRLATQFVTDFLGALTYPAFQVCEVGLLAKPQLSGYGSVHTFPEPRLGQVFTANVLGHYMLVHWLAPLLHEDTRVVWVSSIGGLASTFNMEDLQGITAEMAYDSSKRLTDLLVLTSELPSTRPYLETFLPVPARTNASEDVVGNTRPRMYVTHPGVIQTSISDVAWFLLPFIKFTMYVARWLGSKWHPTDPYKGAVSMVHTVLCPPSQLPELDRREGKGKWGSATDLWGEERVARTEVEGWEFTGQLGLRPSGSVASTHRAWTKATKESREQFEEQGREAWKEMEALRVDWEKRLGRIEVDVKQSVDI